MAVITVISVRYGQGLISVNLCPIIVSTFMCFMCFLGLFFINYMLVAHGRVPGAVFGFWCMIMVTLLPNTRY